MRGSTIDGIKATPRPLALTQLALTPDIIHASGTQGTIALKQLTRTVPIFARVGDPVGLGIVDSLARPGVCRSFGFM